ncbi:sensor histidine kinase [Steroidobacter cummioxidans]|uniref:sensor histidine kinase n=1 Tax=Steroidobacter cummioxidans TaxID=1803913 RepID=UPI000E30D082|nr:ATP-binding protein [Steroidobacter cummioxidans]
MKRQEDRTGAGPMFAGSAMGEAIIAKDWTSHALGTIDKWPLSLRTALGICLGFPAPSCIAWGEQRSQLYNDAYSRVSLIHGEALGVDFAHSWVQSWPAMHACFERATRGESARLENQQVSLDRDGGSELVVVTLSFVPVHDDSGGIGGVLITLFEASSTELREELRRSQAALEQRGHVLSHDFRAPLRMLEQMSKILVTDHAEQLPPRTTGLLDHIGSGAAKLAMRVEALTRFDTLSQRPLHRQSVDVAALTSKIIAELRAATPDRQIEVVVEELPPARADFELLRLVCHNLLTNAFKFTRHAAQPRIEVSGKQQGHHIVYCVKDNGVGFDPKYARRLFGIFQRMHTEEEFEGLGTGLAMAKQLIERHGGTIWAEAEKGRGAEFRFTLPA